MEVISNNFTGCNGVNSIVMVSKRSDDHGVLIHDNLFDGNSALYGAQAVFVEVVTEYDYDSTETFTYMPCAGVQISDNVFQNNVG